MYMYMGGSENSELGAFIGADGVRSAEAYACACLQEADGRRGVYSLWFTRQVAP